MAENLAQLTEAGNLEGKRVIMVGGIDVPVKDGEISETFRLDRIKPTVDYLKEQQAKIILIGHIGHEVPQSTEPVARYFGLRYVDSLDPGVVGKEVSALSNGEGVVLKNVRSDKREEANDDSFARELASCADIYVNEDFPTSHRNYVSIVGIAKYLPGYMGLEFESEIKHLSSALSPGHPSLVILGGAKADTKIPLVHKFAEGADKLFVGGSLANTLCLAKGYEMGTSLVDGSLEEAKKILAYPNILMPIDVVVDHAGGSVTKKPDAIQAGEAIQDIGLDTIQLLGKEARKAKFILWNGPLGVYEKGYKEGTESLAKILAETKAVTILGGGDTVASIKKLGLLDKFTFVSIGGGAMIDFLVDGTLPAIEALKSSKK